MRQKQHLRATNHHVLQVRNQSPQTLPLNEPSLVVTRQIQIHPHDHARSRNINLSHILNHSRLIA